MNADSVSTAFDWRPLPQATSLKAKMVADVREEQESPKLRTPPSDIATVPWAQCDRRLPAGVSHPPLEEKWECSTQPGFTCESTGLGAAPAESGGSMLRPSLSPRWKKQRIKGSNGGSSKYRGVSWNKKARKWAVEIKQGGVTHHLGDFSEEAVAAHAYDDAARRLHGSAAVLNFAKADEANNVALHTSTYKGVSWNKVNNRWTVQIYVAGRVIFVGRFPDEDAAARAHDSAVYQHRFLEGGGKNVKSNKELALNFPGEVPGACMCSLCAGTTRNHCKVVLGKRTRPSLCTRKQRYHT